MTINPYDLFGIVNADKSNLKELKKKYYELALLVHPDKNNSQDGADMHVVHMAYKYCREQLENAENRKTSVEQLEKEFERFCKEQAEAPPPFRDIVDDALEMAKFNKTFEECHIETGYGMSFKSGYGDLMEKSEYASFDSNVDMMEYEEKEDKPLGNDFGTLTIYKDPIEFKSTGDYFDFEKKDPMKSYTVYIKKTCLSDYKEANTTEDLGQIQTPHMRTIEEVMAEREHL